MLRNAGFPATRVEALGDRRLATTADRCLAGLDSAGFETEFTAATARLTAVTREIAADDRFREAVTWQNLGARRRCLDQHVAGRSTRARTLRRNQLTVAMYLQRYALKNDTIGFFGPVGWAQWRGGQPALRLTIGEHLLARRRVYFECWTIDVLARVLCRDPELVRWLRPRLGEAELLVDGAVHRPRGDRIDLSPPVAALAALCGGQRPVTQIAELLVAGPDNTYRSEVDVVAALHRLDDRDLIRLDLDGPVEAEPEATLRDKLLGVPDPRPRERALAVLGELVTARDGVTRAAGAQDQLAPALDLWGSITLSPSLGWASTRPVRTR